MRYDRDGDQHYDVASAFIKSIRGSDVDAALHYLARMIEAGEDPRFIARRLVILASEDIGLADPTALAIAVAAAPGGGVHRASRRRRSTLAQAVIALATAPKTNAVTMAIGAAMADVRHGLAGAGAGAAARRALRRGEEDSTTGAATYIRTTTRPAIVEQQYAPDEVAGREYYQPTQRGAELPRRRG